MFPVQLMTVRRSKNGSVRSIFLSEDSSDYCLSVMEVFLRSTGKTRSDIEKELRIVELKSQNPKVMRGLALLMFRLSTMSRPSPLDPAAVRDSVFSLAKTPVLSHEDREKVLLTVAGKFNSSVSEVDNAIYADNEDNEILTRVAKTDPEKLARLYNIEQIETVMLKSQWMEIRTRTNRNRFVRRIRSLGLLYSEKFEGGDHLLMVSGPVSILEHSERYGSKFSLLVRYVLRFGDWEIDASVKLKKGKEKDEFRYHLDQSVSEFTGIISEQEEKLPGFVEPEPEPVRSGNSLFYPDYAVRLEDETVNVFLTTPRYYSEDLEEIAPLAEGNSLSEVICILAKNEKCPPGAKCFRETIDWFSLRDDLSVPLRTKNPKPKTILPTGSTIKAPIKTSVSEEVNSHLKALYPDSQAMVDYLEFMGLPPAETLEKAGFKVKWQGFRINVQE